MDPKIYKPGSYKSPGIYKGTGGIYKGRGVYNDGYGGGGGGETYTFYGKTYNVVTIGNLKWFVENLDFAPDDMPIGGTISYTITSKHAYYYLNDEATYGWNGRKYGLLYNRYAVDAIKYYLTDGWRIPTESDFSDLTANVPNQDANKLKSLDYWPTPGNNELGFNAKPCPATDTGNQWFFPESDGGYIISDTITGSKSGLYVITNNTITYYQNGASFYISVPIRLCKDA